MSKKKNILRILISVGFIFISNETKGQECLEKLKTIHSYVPSELDLLKIERSANEIGWSTKIFSVDEVEKKNFSTAEIEKHILPYSSYIKDAAKQEDMSLLKISNQLQTFLNNKETIFTKNLIDKLERSIQHCSSAVDNGFDCKGSIPYKQFVTAINRMISKVRGLKPVDKSSMKIFVEAQHLAELIGRVDDVPLFKNSMISVKSNCTDECILELNIPVQMGEGFSSKKKWDDFVAVMNRVISSYWHGQIVLENQQIIKMTTIVIASTNKNAVKINVIPSGKLYEYRAEYDFFAKTLRLSDDLITGRMKDWKFVLSHEFGHVLGFSDRYVFEVDLKSCVLLARPKQKNIMTALPEAHPSIQDSQLTQLYRQYVKGNEKSLESFQRSMDVFYPGQK